MKCRRCNKDIDEYEIFCNDCKKILKRESSRNEVKELENLIEENQKLNELDNTKELNFLSDLYNSNNNNKLENTNEMLLDTSFLEEEKKSNKKSLIITLVIIVILLILGGFGLFIYFNKPEEIIIEEKIDYEKILNEYGKATVKISKKYISENEDIPTWKNILENLSYKKYDVFCSIHEVYEDGSVYLDKCIIDNNKIDYKFGEKKIEEIIEDGKNIEIYRSKTDLNHFSNNKYNDDFELIGSINCKTKSCEYINAYDNYVLIRENQEYYLYDYTNKLLNFGPFDLENEFTDMLFYNSKLYGILYKDGDNKNLYNIKNNKILKNIKGNVEEVGMYYEPNILFKYNLLLLKESDKYNFVNINTGNVSFTINDNIREFIDDKNNKVAYITTYTDNPDLFKIINSNGKLLFGGKEYNYISISKNIIVSTLTNFKVYDSKLNLKITSSKYNKILGVFKDFVVVSDNNKIKIINLYDEELASFDIDFENGNYTFHKLLSGYKNDSDICLIIENNDISYGNNGSGIECHYDTIKKESNIIETEGIVGNGM